MIRGGAIVHGEVDDGAAGSQIRIVASARILPDHGDVDLAVLPGSVGVVVEVDGDVVLDDRVVDDREGRRGGGDGAAAAVADDGAVEAAVIGGRQHRSGVAGRGGASDGGSVEQPLVGEGASACGGDGERLDAADVAALVDRLGGDGGSGGAAA